MGRALSVLWRAPDLNPITGKARSIPVLNPVDPYGRVFTFSWLGFMLSFWAWYAFPPLLTKTIKADLHLSAADVANSNIVSLCATLLLRFAVGPVCDRYGARITFASLMLLGCVPIGLAPLVRDAAGLCAARFFIGVLGATFVPCQVWCTAFFDSNVVGTANALAGGWGNAGGGVTYFIMPAVFDSLVSRQGMSDSTAWRVTLVVPLACLLTCALGMLFLCPDKPLDDDDDRKGRAQSIETRSSEADADELRGAAAVPGTITGSTTPDEEKGTPAESRRAAKDGTVAKPKWRATLSVVFCPQSLFHVATYACSFGAELAINSILASYLQANFPTLSQTRAGNLAAVFGFLNFVARPLGGAVADVLYNSFGHSLWLKKAWIICCGLVAGTLLIVIGRVDPSEQSGGGLGTMMALIVLTAMFLEAGNGANFALIPHVHPAANGVVSGITGGGGNLGGVLFSIIFRLLGDGKGYGKAFWIIGASHVGLNLAVSCIAPEPARQAGSQGP
ncbi:hypothetical protein CDD83_8671 [Cordyceps sp. RAO-2017]|nr:hypothetical protein CDD83_8671 [Cordyceps sp. RAO-2017]